MDYGALVQLAVGLIGEFLGNGEKAKAEALYRELRQKFEGIPLPKLEEIEAQQLGPSALESVRVDPTLEAAQYGALGQLGDISQTGLADADRAALNRIANMTARRQKAGMAGIEQSMAQRGLAGSGLEYGARLQAAQDANQRLSEEGMNVAGDAAQRRLNAILARGDLSGRMRGQQYSEKANAARARDDIMRYNAAARDSANRFNQGQRQQGFQNQMQRTGAVANPMNALAGFKLQQGQDTQGFYGNLGAAAGTAVNSASRNSNSNNWGSGPTYGYQDALDNEDDNGYLRRHKLNYGEDR